MCWETHIPRDMCAGNTHPWETCITVTPVQTESIKFGGDWTRLLSAHAL